LHALSTLCGGVVFLILGIVMSMTDYDAKDLVIYFFLGHCSLFIMLKTKVNAIIHPSLMPPKDRSGLLKK